MLLFQGTYFFTSRLLQFDAHVVDEEAWGVEGEDKEDLLEFPNTAEKGDEIATRLFTAANAVHLVVLTQIAAVEQDAADTVGQPSLTGRRLVERHCLWRHTEVLDCEGGHGTPLRQDAHTGEAAVQQLKVNSVLAFPQYATPVEELPDADPTDEEMLQEVCEDKDDVVVGFG